MRVVVGKPPNYEEIVKVLGRPPSDAVYAWGETIYATSDVPPDLLVHEATHHLQQQRLGSPEAWWRRYLDDAEFRLGQEIEAYRNQYRWLRERLPRPGRREALRQLAKSLSSPMYGRLVNRDAATRLISAA